MNAEELRQIPEDCCNDISFTYKREKSGVVIEVENFIPNFIVAAVAASIAGTEAGVYRIIFEEKQT